MISDTANAVITKTANAAQYGGSGAAVYFGLSANEIAAFGGLLIAVIGLLINIWFKHQHLKLAKSGLRVPDDE
jgi:hypothetical protein